MQIMIKKIGHFEFIALCVSYFLMFWHDIKKILEFVIYEQNHCVLHFMLNIR